MTSEHTRLPSSREQPGAGAGANGWRVMGGAALIVIAFGTLFLLPGMGDTDRGASGSGSIIVLAIPAFLAGLLSFLSPCCLPVLSAYTAFTLQMERTRLLTTTVAFFLGLATTMVVLGASATALSRLMFQYLPLLTKIGGFLVIGFGVMSLLGKGFSGPSLLKRHSQTTVGAYVYGATFALGWTACVGPILGALLTMLATQGIAVLQGAALAFLYALGLGSPLIALALSLRQVDTYSRLWRIMRGRGFEVQLGSTTLYLHTTSLVSGVLLIVVGVMLVTGQLTLLSQWSLRTPVGQWILGIEDLILRLFAGTR